MVVLEWLGEVFREEAVGVALLGVEWLEGEGGECDVEVEVDVSIFSASLCN